QYAVLANRITNAVEKHRTQAELADRERRLNLFFEQSPLGVVEWDADFDLVRMNDAAEEILGYAESELIGESWERIVPDAERESVSTVVEELLENDDGYYSRNENVREDGERIVCEWHNRVVTDDAGDVVAVFSQFRDVTERERRQERLEETLARLETLFESSPDMINVHDAEGNILTPNPRLCEETGYDADELAGTKIWELDASIDPEEARSLWDRMDAGDRHSMSGRYRRSDGSTFPVEVHVRRLDLEGRSRFVAISRDVTARRQRERDRAATVEFLQSLYDVATDQGSTATEKINRLLEIGPKKLGLPYGHLTRIERADGGDDNGDGNEDGTQTIVEASGDHALLQPGESCPLSRSYCRRTIERGGVLEVQDALAEGWAGDPAYETFDLACYIGTPITVDGELYGTVFFASDAPHAEPFTDAERTFVRLMSQLVSDELERERMLTELKRQNERLEEFASVVSHDLQGPLSVARGRLELAREECGSEHLESVSQAHERMDALIDDLLTLARHGETDRDLEPVDLSALAERCWHNVATADATLVTDTERRVRADRERLQQLVENLTRNAVEHGGGDVTVSVGATEDGFYVEDDGPGVPEAERGDVFDAGYSTAADGTGFGLNIAERVSEAHGWEIRLTNGSDGGARFEITGVEFVAG
ncbi:PAS domain S-box protein, partial [Natronomonas sp.]|uniref:sensor histidine kinase n=1 Tax=Natronomonas sp. TaxID=2184060 RepID=UPI00262073F1